MESDSTLQYQYRLQVPFTLMNFLKDFQVKTEQPVFSISEHEVKALSSSQIDSCPYSSHPSAWLYKP